MRLAKRKMHVESSSFIQRGCTPADYLSSMWVYNAPVEVPPVFGPVRMSQRGWDEADWNEAKAILVEAFQEICLYNPKHVEIVRLTRRARCEEELQQLNNHFYFKDSRLVSEFLKQHGFLIPVLFNVRKKIDQYFSSDTLSNLELFADPDDNNSTPRLFALILTALPSDDASTRLEQLDEEWWLGQPREVRRVLSLDVDYIDGV